MTPSPSPLTRLGALAIWLGLITWAATCTPPARPDLIGWAMALAIGDWTTEDPFIVAVFNGMGMLPVLFAHLLHRQLRARPVPAWPFVVASMGIGIFALLPWLAIARPDPDPPRLRPTLRRLLSGWALPLSAGLVMGGLGIWGVVQGSLLVYFERMQTDGFLMVLIVDFYLLHALFAGLAWSRGHRFWPVALVPFGGPALVLVSASAHMLRSGAARD